MPESDKAKLRRELKDISEPYAKKGVNREEIKNMLTNLYDVFDPSSELTKYGYSSLLFDELSNWCSDKLQKKYAHWIHSPPSETKELADMEKTVKEFLNKKESELNPEIIKYQKQIKKLKETNKTLRADKSKLRKEVKELKKKNKELKEENNKL